MRVYVVRMRYRSRKLGRDEVLRTAPLDGELRLCAMHAGRGQSSELMAGLTPPGESRWLLPPLLNARVTQIRGTHMVITGAEQLEIGRDLVTHRQAWWVWLPPPNSPSTPPGPGSDGQPTTTHLADFPLEPAEVA